MNKRGTRSAETKLEQLRATIEKIVSTSAQSETEKSLLRSTNEDLRSINKKLMFANAQLTCEVTQTTAGLKRVDTQLEQFAYIASHDLQEPLRMLSIYTELLETKLAGILDEDTIKYFDITSYSAKRIKLLVSALLDFSRITREELKTDPTDCTTVVSDVLVSLKPLVEESGARVKCNDLPTILFNEFLLSKIFQHLISNAIKFRRPSQDPEIHISFKEAATEWQFSIQDNGIGIKKEYTDRIFLIFQRLHGGREYPGTGIGLSVCKNIVERYGGRMWLESDLEKGSVFFFTLPKVPRKDFPSVTQAGLAA